MQSDKIRRILKENKDLFKTLKNYDKTRQLPFQRKRIDVTLSVSAINKLKKLKKETGKPVSRIIEERIEQASSEKMRSAKAEPEPEAEPAPSYIC